MDNLTHSLIGLAASKAGLEKLSPGTTTLCVPAANAPDSDILVLIFGGRWAFLHHHRGITHSIVGTAALGLILPLIFYGGNLLLSRLRGTTVRVRLPGLIFASLIVSATHPLMDWTNNYGVRFLLPWSGRWFYGDLVFVVDPFLWLLFGSAAFLLTSNSKRQVALWTLLGGMLTSLLLYAAASGRGLEHPGLILSFWIVVVIAIISFYRVDLGKRLGARLAATAFLILFL